MTALAAGILYTCGNRALFLQRSADSSFPGTWSWPGGRAEDGEDLSECALREAREECGDIPNPALRYLTRSAPFWRRDPIPMTDAADGVSSGVGEGSAPLPLPDSSGDVDFTTFHQAVGKEFTPTLNDEHTAFVWAPTANPPQPLHPGAQIALDRLNMDELGVAEAIADGRLTSPQRYENMLLVAMRVSGTGVSYRRAHDEFVWRDPSVWITDRMIKRVAGLPVIVDHPPDKAMLDTKEFSDRAVGTVFLPFVRGEDLWCVAKIWDMPTAKMIEEEKLSTSPAVVFRDLEVNTKLTSDDGNELLIEGKPSLVDHLAICRAGVWDRGGEPSGIEVSEPVSEARKDSQMTEEEKQALAAKDKAKKDAVEETPGDDIKENMKKDASDSDSGVELDKILAHLDALHKRMDAMEAGGKKDADKGGEGEKKEFKEKDSKNKDEDPDLDDQEKDEPKKAVADKRKDAEEKEDKKERMDAAVFEELSELRRKYAALETLVKPRPAVDEAVLADAQARADAVYTAFGKRAPAPLAGETVLAYRRRLLSEFKDRSTAWKDIDLRALPGEVLDVAEPQVYKDAMDAANSPHDIGGSAMRELRKRDSLTGREIIEFRGGRPMDWMEDFCIPTRLARISYKTER